MPRQPVTAVALLVIAWLCSCINMAAAQPSASWQLDEQDGDPPTPGLPLPMPPPDEFNPPDYEPASAAPEPETPVPSPPTAPSRQRLPPSPPAAPRVSNYTATGRTTMLVFGDSTVDPGNNNQLQTAAKANFLPYGMSFYGGKPTGRFSNGRLITDILAEKLGIARSIPGFLDPKLKPGQMMAGVSFASAGSGYDDATAKRSSS